MYEYIKGILIEHTPTYVVIEAAQMAYHIKTPSSLLGKLGSISTQVKLYLYFHIRENAQTFYGFATKEDRDLFELMLSISKIGPKIALAILSYYSRASLSEVIAQNNINALSQVPGIGKKSAERILIELKSKIEYTHQVGGSNTLDAITALIQLGYTHSVAEKSVHLAAKQLSDQAELSQLISEALRQT